jgi:competence protein ComEC
VALLLAALSLWLRAPAWLRGVLLVVAAALTAFGQGAWRAEQRLAEALDPAWEGRDLRLVGRIASLPQRVAGQGGLPGWRFEFAVESAADAADAEQSPRVPQRLLLSSYLRSEAGRPAPRWQPGERWALVARLRQPHGSANPQGWDYELHLFERGLRATGVLRSAERIDDGGWPAAWLNLDRWRQRLRDAIARQLGGRDDGGAAAGVIAGLSLGEQASIRPADWALFRATGVAHLMAISGLHITMFAWGAAAVAGALWRRSERACLCLPAPTAGLWAGVGCAALYAGFSGWGVPAQRTVWMLLSLALLRQLGLRWP